MAKVLQPEKSGLDENFSGLTAAISRDSAAKSRDAQRLVRKDRVFAARAIART
jgi:hypothetical protein